MSGLIFACIAPHGSMIIPLLGEKGAEKALATRAAMQELGRRVAAAQPETLVVITPHGHRVDGCFSLLNNRRVQGTLDPQPRVVIACPDRGNMPWELFAPFGLSIRKAAETLHRRVAFVASADLGHAHDAQGPYGYDIASQEFDTALVDAVKARDLARLSSFDLD